MAGSAFNGSHDCVQCCSQSAFETSAGAGGAVWRRPAAAAVSFAPSAGVGSRSPWPWARWQMRRQGWRQQEGAGVKVRWVRYGYDALVFTLVQCPFFG